MEVCDLTGAALDKWVGKACGYDLDADGDNRTIRDNGGAPSSWHPSTDWSQGGPIIEQAKIMVRPPESVGDSDQWHAFTYGGVDAVAGPTLLVAAMRAFVASKFGDTVPDE